MHKFIIQRQFVWCKKHAHFKLVKYLSKCSDVHRNWLKVELRHLVSIYTIIVCFQEISGKKNPHIAILLNWL